VGDALLNLSCNAESRVTPRDAVTLAWPPTWMDRPVRDTPETDPYASAEREAIVAVERETEAERDPFPHLGPEYKTAWGTVARSAPWAPPLSCFGPP